MDMKPEKVKNTYFSVFLNFTDIFEVTDISTYFKPHWHFYENVLFRRYIKLRTLDIKSDLMIQILAGSKIVNS